MNCSALHSHLAKLPQFDNFSHCLAAANCHDDLQLVVFQQVLNGESAARDDSAVALQRDALAGQSHFFNKAGNCCACGKLAGFAIDADGDHFARVVHVRIRAAFYYKRV
jgi:hypothetical protein